MSRVANNWTYEDEMQERREQKADGFEQCAIIGDPDYAGRCCPADGVSMCADCPGKDIN